MNKGEAMKMIVDDRVDNDPSNYRRRQTMSGMVMLERERERERAISGTNGRMNKIISCLSYSAN